MSAAFCTLVFTVVVLWFTASTNGQYAPYTLPSPSGYIPSVLPAAPSFLPPTGPLINTAAITSCILSDGRPQVFAVDYTGVLHTSYKQLAALYCDFSGWFLFSPSPVVKELTCTPLPDGRPSLTVIDVQGNIWFTQKQTTAFTSNWTAFATLPPPSSSAAVQITSFRLGNGTSALMVTDASQPHVTAYTGVITSLPNSTQQVSWSSLNLFHAPNLELVDLSSFRLTDGRPRVNAVDISGIIWTTWPASQSGTDWVKWIMLTTPQWTVSLSSTQLVDGRPQIYALDYQGYLWGSTALTTAWDSTFTAFLQLSTIPMKAIGTCLLQDGRPQLFAAGAPGVTTLISQWQVGGVVSWNTPMCSWQVITF